MMMSLMLRLLSIILISSTIASAGDKTVEQKLVSFIGKAINTGKSYKFKDVKVIHEEIVPWNKKWKAYFLKIDLKIPSKNKTVSVRDIIFSDGTLISKDFIDINSGRSIKNSFSFPASPKLYDDKHLLIGNKNAKNKLILFSDPLCPFCMDYVPDLISWIKKHDKNFALYYYYFPLSIHPASITIVKAEIAAQKLGKFKNLTSRVYNEAFDFENANEANVLKKFNKTFKTNLTIKEINQKDILQRVKNDIKVANDLMVRGTPTLYVNGKKDPTRSLYKKLAKESK
ncbi:MAG: thioredoxin domain-containing protein [Campylobacteraceae bacterium]|nr:thioredoxin domain-containing protein [Campylobacteraceae bacterium]